MTFTDIGVDLYSYYILCCLHTAYKCRHVPGNLVLPTLWPDGSGLHGDNMCSVYMNHPLLCYCMHF